MLKKLVFPLGERSMTSFFFVKKYDSGDVFFGEILEK